MKFRDLRANTQQYPLGKGSYHCANRNKWNASPLSLRLYLKWLHWSHPAWQQVMQCSGQFCFLLKRWLKKFIRNPERWLPQQGLFQYEPATRMPEDRSLLFGPVIRTLSMLKIPLSKTSSPSGHWWRRCQDCLFQKHLLCQQPRLNASELWVCISLFPNHLSPHPTSPVWSCFCHVCNWYEGYRKEHSGDKCGGSFSENLTFRTTSHKSLFKNKTPKQTGLCLTSTKLLVSQEEENMATVLLSIRVKHHLNSSKVRGIT